MHHSIYAPLNLCTDGLMHCQYCTNKSCTDSNWSIQITNLLLNSFDNGALLEQGLDHGNVRG